MITTEGVYPGVPFAGYCAIPAVNASSLHGYARSPLHARYRATHSRDTEELALGRAVHAAILEPDVYAQTYVRRERAKGTGSRAVNARLAADAERAGLVEIKDHERALVESMRDAVLAHPIAGPLIATAIARELTIVWQDTETGAACKARPDILSAHDGRTIVADLKTCRDARPWKFRADALAYSYHVSAAWYLAGLAALGQDAEWWWIAVESEPPHDLAIHRPSDELLEVGRAEWRSALARHLECVATNEWRGYEAVIQEMEKPKWM